MDILKNFYKVAVNLWLAVILLVMNQSTIMLHFAVISPTETPNPALRQDPAANFALKESAIWVSSTLVLPDDFTSSPITSEIETCIRGKSYPENCPVPLSSLRYLTVLHIGFDGQTHEGELIVHEQIAQTVLEIFYKLYLAGYPIEKIRLIDDYNANDEASMADNNTSAFCYRTIAGTDTLSTHSYGLAVDINPLYNPYVNRETVSPAISAYDREAGTVSSPHFMTEGDYCVRLFQMYGFTWGGEWDGVKDYQHFEMKTERTNSSVLSQFHLLI